jgi:hypothetical protein
MIITKNQIDQFEKIKIENFITKTIVFLRTTFTSLFKDKDDIELKEYVNNFISFGLNYGIYEELNIQRLINYCLKYNCQFPLPKALELDLISNKFDENTRIENFYFNLTTERYKLTYIELSNSKGH